MKVPCGCLLVVAIPSRQVDVPAENPAATNAAPVIGEDRVAEAIGAFIGRPGFMDTTRPRIASEMGHAAENFSERFWE